MDETPADSTAEPQPPLPPQYRCPECGATVEGSSAEGPVLICLACNAQFFIPAPQDAEETSQETEAQARAESEAGEAELSAARIRQMSMLTRTAYRTRSYFIIGTLACLGTAAEVITLVVKYSGATHRWGTPAIGGLCLAVAAFIGAAKFFRLALASHREIQAHRRARELEELEVARREPDLSTLSDGSHHARNLEKMTGAGEGETGRGGETETRGQRDGEAL